VRGKSFLDFQNDVKVSDVELAAREGYRSVEHAKRYTTLGMATDQGKLSNVNGLAVLSEALGEPIPQVGTTTFRPPYVPVTMGAIAGPSRGALFLPVRRTPLHARHEALGAAWEPVGHWRRPWSYPQAGETRAQAAEREVLAVRHGVGVLDASTLGKIVVQGPDAGAFLDLIYTGRPSPLARGDAATG
jgi:sarcosine oxidase subunit alpha